LMMTAELSTWRGRPLWYGLTAFHASGSPFNLAATTLDAQRQKLAQVSTLAHTSRLQPPK
jgi:hypothetical protein